MFYLLERTWAKSREVVRNNWMWGKKKSALVCLSRASCDCCKIEYGDRQQGWRALIILFAIAFESNDLLSSIPAVYFLTTVRIKAFYSYQSERAELQDPYRSIEFRSMTLE